MMIWLSAITLFTSAGDPTVVDVETVAPDVLSIVIRSGKVTPSKLTDYVSKPGDQTQGNRLKRGNDEIGWLIGPKKDGLVTFEQLEGEPLKTDVADRVATYRITSSDDPQFRTAVTPKQVYRKSKPTDWAQPSRGFAMLHRIYLRLPQPLTVGKQYEIGVEDLHVGTPSVRFEYEPTREISEAVHVSQIGYRPDDPVKQASLSCWIGSGGALSYPTGLGYSLIDEATGKSVFRGKTTVAKEANEPERMFRSENFNKTGVYRMDFSAFRTVGRYHVAVDGIGSSYSFEIAENAWQRAFALQLKGLYNEHSGVTLSPPSATWTKPKPDFFPPAGDLAYQSTYSILDGGQEGPELEKHKTSEVIKDAWGGYRDAGDWNPRRATHLRVTMAQLEVFDLFPSYFAPMKLGISAPPTVPQILAEAMFEVDLFARLQKPDGGVPFGIETNGDPIDGEVSWKQSMTAYVYAPDPWSSYIYAAAAGRISRLILPFDKDLAARYRKSALKAMEWAEKEYAKRDKAKLRWEVADDRNLAAVEMLALTKDKHWHEIFSENTCLKAGSNLFAYGNHVQRDPAFAYARLDASLTEPALRANAIKGIEEQAQLALAYQKDNAFGITTPDRGKPMFLGFYSTPDAIELVRAHFLTKKAEYLAGAIQACQFSAGMNPNNMTYTTGLGTNPPRNPLFLDTRRTGQPAPTGITVYGNFDFVGWKDQDWANWPLKFFLKDACTPTVYDWPLTEAYFDIFLYPATNEFTVDMWAPNVYVWGYLAGRGR